jgi:hypothetical protein
MTWNCSCQKCSCSLFSDFLLDFGAAIEDTFDFISDFVPSKQRERHEHKTNEFNRTHIPEAAKAKQSVRTHMQHILSKIPKRSKARRSNQTHNPSESSEFNPKVGK